MTAAVENGSLEKRELRATISDVSWRAAEDMSLSEWLEYGRRLGVMGRSAGWWIGDWLTYGNHVFGERYVRASRITGYDAQTLMNMAYVASRFDVSRRRGKLSWSHHAEIAAMEPEEQDHWLERAEADRLSVRCLREGIRRERLRTKAAEEAAEREAHGIDEDEQSSSDMVCPECGHVFLTGSHG
jgi:uncharacterized protein with PIN domain